MKKLVSIALIFTMLSTLVVGCTQSEQSPNSSGEETPQSDSQPVSEEPEQVTLNVFMEWPQYKDQFDNYFEQFKAKELEEKNIEVEIVSEMPNADQVAAILKARLSSNDAPDLFTLRAVGEIPLYYNSGYLMDLSDQPFVDSLIDQVKKGVTYDDKILALPMESLAWGYLYNKDIFEQYEITPPDTLDEMNEVIETLKQNDVAPFLLSYQEAWIPQLMMALALGGIVYSENSDWVDQMNEGNASFADVSDVFNVIDLINANGTENAFEVGNELGCTNFANGEAAMWVQGGWAADTILNANPDFEFGIAPLPVSNDPKGTMINYTVGTCVGVSASTQVSEVALDLINYLLDEEDSSALFESLKFNQVATFMDYEIFPWVAEAMTYVEEGRAYEEVVYPTGVGDQIAKLMQNYYLGDFNQEQMIQELDKVWADGLKAQGDGAAE